MRGNLIKLDLNMPVKKQSKRCDVLTGHFKKGLTSKLCIELMGPDKYH